MTMSGTPDDVSSVPAQPPPGTGRAVPADRSTVPSRGGGRPVCYVLHPRSFADSNGDGVGDLPGATARLEHLQELGVDAVWITPFYPSPLADGGYDITDHTAVAPDLGTQADFDALVQRAHALGVKILVDLVPNHTSDQHPWFREAVTGEARLTGKGALLPAGCGENGELPPSTTGSPRSAALPGPGCRSRTQPRASGTCTCTRRSSRT